MQCSAVPGLQRLMNSASGNSREDLSQLGDQNDTSRTGGLSLNGETYRVNAYSAGYQVEVCAMLTREQRRKQPQRGYRRQDQRHGAQTTHMTLHTNMYSQTVQSESFGLRVSSVGALFRLSHVQTLHDQGAGVQPPKSARACNPQNVSEQRFVVPY